MKASGFEKLDDLDKRVRVHIESVQRLVQLMEDSEARPLSAPKILVEACRTQTSLAKFEMHRLGIYSMSLNTLKALCDKQYIEGGWYRVDSLRRLIFESMGSSKIAERPPKKINLTNEEINSLKLKLDEAFRTRAIIYSAYRDLSALAASMARNDNVFLQRLEEHNRQYGMQFGLKVVKKAAD